MFVNRKSRKLAFLLIVVTVIIIFAVMDVYALDQAMNICERMELSPLEVRALGEMLKAVAR